VKSHALVSDPFVSVQSATRAHQRLHGCGAYTYSDGSLPGAIAAAAHAQRIVEVGTALGYTACWLASTTPTSVVDTIEFDEDHVALAREQISKVGLADRIVVHLGAADDVLTSLPEGEFDLAFFDGFTPTTRTLAGLRSRLRDGGVLLAANLTLGAERGVLEDLHDESRWLTHSFGETAICIKRAPRA
jgi:predicted O-methyltransferase YrrM